MSGPFQTHRDAALTLLSRIPSLSHKEGGFLGHVVVAESLTERQADWLRALLERHHLPELTEAADV